jgi:hypothetical protein
MWNSDNNTAENSGDSHWRAIKDRLAVVAAIVVLLVLFFMMLDQAVINFRCSFGDFITFDCNRWGQIWEASRD